MSDSDDKDVDTPDELAVKAALEEMDRVFRSQREGVAMGESAASSLVDKLVQMNERLQRENKALRVELEEATTLTCGAFHAETGSYCSVMMHHTIDHRSDADRDGDVITWPVAK